MNYKIKLQMLWSSLEGNYCSTIKIVDIDWFCITKWLKTPNIIINHIITRSIELSFNRMIIRTNYSTDHDSHNDKFKAIDIDGSAWKNICWIFLMYATLHPFNVNILFSSFGINLTVVDKPGWTIIWNQQLKNIVEQ